MKKGIIIAGYAGVGKTYLSQKYENIIDLESSEYKYNNTNLKDISSEKRKGMVDRVKRKEWPNNYYKAMEEAIEKYDVIFIQFKPEHLTPLDSKGIGYYIAYPNLNEWEWLERRFINRGNNAEWILKIKNGLQKYFDYAKESKAIDIIMVGENYSIEDFLKQRGIIK